MADLSEFKRGQIVAARRTGVSIRKPAEWFDIGRSTVSKIMITFEKEGKSFLCEEKRKKKDKIIWKKAKVAWLGR